MKTQPLVSIIIPTYNRGHLIGETLDSVLAQTYKNWECIIVDDGSTDNTDEVVGNYVNKDSRFQYYHRPDEHLPGGNGARNYGFKMSQGEYVNWFDSDDLMYKNKLESKIGAIKLNDYQLIISKSKFFNIEKDYNLKQYEYLNNKIKTFEYCLQKVNWVTSDALIKRDILLNISFNENLKSGQEFNFFSRLMQLNPKIYFVDKNLTHRRYHDDSITSILNKDKNKLKQERFEKMWFTYNDIKNTGTKKSIDILIYKCLSLYYKRQYTNLPLTFYKEAIIQYGFKSVLLIPLSVLRHFNRGYFLLQKFKPI